MEADKPLYAQFDGDEFDGRRYALGEEIASDMGSGTIEYLKVTGRIGFAKPATSIVVPANDRPLDSMTRAELEATIRAETPIPADVSDDELRSRIEDVRAEAEAKRTAEADSAASDEVSYDDLKDKPLAGMTTAQLEKVAFNEEVAFGAEVKTNADRASAIQAARDAKATS